MAKRKPSKQEIEARQKCSSCKNGCKVQNIRGDCLQYSPKDKK